MLCPARQSSGTHADTPVDGHANGLVFSHFCTVSILQYMWQVDPELVEHFETGLTQVRTVPVKTSSVPLASLKVPPPRTEEFNSVEASLRLDALASAGFKMSRSKV